MGENKDLLDEIEKLDDTEEVIKEKASLHEKIFTIVIIVIIIIALTMLYFSYKGNYIVTNKKSKSEDYSSYLENVVYDENTAGENSNEELDYEVLKQQQIQKFEEQKAGLNITTQISDINKKLIAVLHNSNQENISDVQVQVIFYDAENKPIQIAENFISLIEVNMDYYMLFDKTPENYARYDFLITKELYNTEYTSYSGNITYEIQEKEDSKIKIVGKNNSDKKIEEINFFVIYYNENNEIISIKTVNTFDVKKNKEFKIDFYNSIYNDKDYSEVPFARYEVKPASIYSYNEK